MLTETISNFYFQNKVPNTLNYNHGTVVLVSEAYDLFSIEKSLNVLHGKPDAYMPV